MNIFVKSLKGHTVRNPLDNRMIDPEGLEVRDTLYIRRRIEDGDLIISKKPKIKKTAVIESDTDDETKKTDKGDK